MTVELKEIIVRVRARPSDVTKWRRAADKDRVTLSDWMRRALDHALDKRKR